MEEWRLGENSQEMREGLEEYQGCDGKRLGGEVFPEGRSLAEKYAVVLKGVMHALAWGQEQTEACSASTLLLGLWARKQKDFYVWEQASRQTISPFPKGIMQLFVGTLRTNW